MQLLNCNSKFKIQNSKFKIVLILVLVGLLAACGSETGGDAKNSNITSGLITAGPTAEAQAMVGQGAPDFSWKEGEHGQSLAKLKGHPVVLNWWASWCEPCRDEMPLLTEAARAKPELKIIGINLKESEPDVLRFATKYNLKLNLVRDEAASLSAAYRVRGLPQTVFVDSAGIVRGIVRGTLNKTSLAENLELIKGT